MLFRRDRGTAAYYLSSALKACESDTMRDAALIDITEAIAEPQRTNTTAASRGMRSSKTPRPIFVTGAQSREYALPPYKELNEMTFPAFALERAVQKRREDTPIWPRPPPRTRSIYSLHARRCV